MKKSKIYINFTDTDTGNGFYMNKVETKVENEMEKYGHCIGEIKGVILPFYTVYLCLCSIVTRKDTF